MQISLFLSIRNGAPCYRTVSARFSKNNKIAGIGAPSYRKNSEAVVSNSNGAVLFGFPGYSLGPKTKKTRDFQQTEKKEQNSAKNRDFFRPTERFKNKSAKIREAGKPKKKTKNIKNALLGHFREDLGTEDLG